MERGRKRKPRLRDIHYRFLEESQVKVLDTGFVGRRRELQARIRCLRKGGKKVRILLYGTGGLGKSFQSIEKFMERSTLS